MSEKHLSIMGGTYDRIVCDLDGTAWVRERTCENNVRKGQGVMPRLECSNCGHVTTDNAPSQFGESEMVWPRFCGNCGAKVVSE